MTNPNTPPNAPKAAEGEAGLRLREMELTPAQQMAIYERQQQSRMIAGIKGATWAAEVDAATIRHIAMWARENDVEPVTEINVLGGNIYLNARYYERKLGELLSMGLVESFKRDWIHIDLRLEKLADAGDEEAINEVRRRLFERIQHGVDDTADFACAFTIKYRGIESASIGVKQHIPGKKRKSKRRDGTWAEVDADPVGDQYPMETIETRSIRRAMLKLRAAFPPEFKFVRRDEDTVEMAEIVATGHEVAKAQQEIERTLGKKPLAQLNAPNPLDPYQTEMSHGEPIVVGGGATPAEPTVKPSRHTETKSGGRILEIREGPIPASPDAPTGKLIATQELSDEEMKREWDRLTGDSNG